MGPVQGTQKAEAERERPCAQASTVRAGSLGLFSLPPFALLVSARPSLWRGSLRKRQAAPRTRDLSNGGSAAGGDGWLRGRRDAARGSGVMGLPTSIIPVRYRVEVAGRSYEACRTWWPIAPRKRSSWQGS